MDRQTLEYGTKAPTWGERSALGGGLFLALVVSGALLGLRSFIIIRDIADREPFYGCSPAQIREMMRVAIELECLWLVWVIAVATCVWAKWLGRWDSLILVWAAFWIMFLWSGINQYASDLAVVESPNKDWFIAHGKHAGPPPPVSPGQ